VVLGQSGDNGALVSIPAEIPLAPKWVSELVVVELPSDVVAVRVADESEEVDQSELELLEGCDPELSVGNGFEAADIREEFDHEAEAAEV